MLKILDVEYLGNRRLEIDFNNGEKYVVDLNDQLEGEMFSPLKDEKLFIQFGLTNGVIQWVNGADLAPEFLYNLGVTQNSQQSAKAK